MKRSCWIWVGAAMTAIDDDTVGQHSSGSSGAPSGYDAATAPGLLQRVNASEVTLLWTPSVETNVQYFIYRSTSSSGPFTNHIATVSENTWTDTAPPPPGSRTYAVKTVQLVTTGSGSYTNLSQAVFISP